MNGTQQKRDGGIKPRHVVLVFAICALADFVWAMLEKRSLAEAIISAVVGLFGTAWYLLIMRAAEDNDPDDPNWPARMALSSGFAISFPITRRIAHRLLN